MYFNCNTYKYYYYATNSSWASSDLLLFTPAPFHTCGFKKVLVCIYVYSVHVYTCMYRYALHTCSYSQVEKRNLEHNLGYELTVGVPSSNPAESEAAEVSMDLFIYTYK